MGLDGALVAYGDPGRPKFHWLHWIGENPYLLVMYQVFDLLWLNGHSTENLNYLQRKELLKEALKETEFIKYHDHVLEKGEDFFKLVENMGLEGMMAKKIESTYSEGTRNGEWLKVKSLQTEEVIICGFTEPKGGRRTYGYLFIGRYERNKLICSGHTGTGFSDKKFRELKENREPVRH